MAGPRDRSETVTSQQHGKSVQISQAIVKDTEKSVEQPNLSSQTRRRCGVQIDV